MFKLLGDLWHVKITYGWFVKIKKYAQRDVKSISIKMYRGHSANDKGGTMTRP